MINKTWTPGHRPTLVPRKRGGLSRILRVFARKSRIERVSDAEARAVAERILKQKANAWRELSKY